jgi:RimJ/RimL family protein N-acetyltransferase
MAVVPIELRDDEISLGDYTDADVSGLVENGTDPETISCRRSLIPQSEEAARRFIDRGVRLAEERSELNWAVHDAGTGEYLGTIIARLMDEYADLAYSVRPQARGRGVATRALTLAAGHVLALPEIDHLNLYIDEDNAPARRVAEKAGFAMVERFPGVAGAKAVYVLTAG